MIFCFFLFVFGFGGLNLVLSNKGVKKQKQQRETKRTVNKFRKNSIRSFLMAGKFRKKGGGSVDRFVFRVTQV